MTNIETEKQNREAVAAAVMAFYVAQGRPATFEEIAIEASMPVARVRRVIVDARDFVIDGVEMTEEQRPSYSKSYRHMVSGSHKVRVFAPTREAMRQEIRRRMA